MNHSRVSEPENESQKLIVVKLRNDTDVPPSQRPEEYLKEKLQVLDRRVHDLGNAKVIPLLTYWSPGDLAQRIAEAQERDPTYTGPRLSYFLALEVPPGVEPEEVIAALKSLEQVETAYLSLPGESPAIQPENDPKARQQGYLESAPAGIGVRDVWPTRGGGGISGSAGEGIALVDMELGWTLDHVDLVAHGAKLLYGTIVPSEREHGTSVLGVVAAMDNRLGCIGIAPKLASIGVVSYAANRRQDRVNALAAAIDALEAGDVLLIEAQLPGRPLPIEADLHVYEYIRLATARGIVVVEAAGNGERDLDTYTDPSGVAVLRRGVRDSLAIMVAAATSSVPHVPLRLTNRGSRIDCYAWGENVVTLSSDGNGSTTLYRDDFGGTSSAAAIIAGAALSAQGMAHRRLGRRLGPLEMRDLLSNQRSGTPSGGSQGARADRIGVMPNLAAH